MLVFRLFPPFFFLDNVRFSLIACSSKSMHKDVCNIKKMEKKNRESFQDYQDLWTNQQTEIFYQ